MSIENIIFYDACQLALRALGDTNESYKRIFTEEPSLNEILGHLDTMYIHFLVKGSELEANLSEPAKSGLICQFRSQHITEVLCDRESAKFSSLIEALRAARDEVVQLMFFDTFSRFLMSDERINLYKTKRYNDPSVPALHNLLTKQTAPTLSTILMIDQPTIGTSAMANPYDF
jgi:hypothetical protein